MSTTEAIVIIIIALAMMLWLPLIICGNWKYWEDKCYAKRLIREPDRYSRCAICGRPRPHKKMMDVKQRGGWCCDEHFGL